MALQPGAEVRPSGIYASARAVATRENLDDIRGQLLAELEQAREELALAKARCRELFDDALEAYVTTDDRGVIREANLHGAALLGLPPGVLRGKLLIAFVARGDTRIFRERLRALGDPATSVDLELRIRPRGRRPVVVSMSSLTSLDPRGRPNGHRWTLRVL